MERGAKEMPGFLALLSALKTTNPSHADKQTYIFAACHVSRNINRPGRTDKSPLPGWMLERHR